MVVVFVEEGHQVKHHHLNYFNISLESLLNYSRVRALLRRFFIFNSHSTNWFSTECGPIIRDVPWDSSKSHWRSQCHMFEYSCDPEMTQNSNCLVCLWFQLEILIRCQKSENSKRNKDSRKNGSIFEPSQSYAQSYAPDHTFFEDFLSHLKDPSVLIIRSLNAIVSKFIQRNFLNWPVVVYRNSYHCLFIFHLLQYN